MNIDTYISELVPKEQRGPAFAYNQFVMFTVVPVVALLAWLLVPQTILGLDGWRWVVIIGSAGALPVWWIRLRLPKSPRWLAQHGRAQEAGRILGELEARVVAETGQPLPAPQMLEGEANTQGAPKPNAWREMWSPPFRGRTLMLVVYNLFQTIGYYGFASWVPTFLIQQGIEVTRSLQYTFIIAIANPGRAALGRVVRRQDRAQMADRLGGARDRCARANTYALTDPRDDKMRIEETKGGLLEGSYHWILENSDFQQWRNDQQSRLLWIRGDPGKGKTMLLCGITNELQESMAKTDLLSYFFCQATDSRINNATAVLQVHQTSQHRYSVVDSRVSGLTEEVGQKYPS